MANDFSGPEFIEAVHEFQGKAPLRFAQQALREDFASQRNYVKSLCRGKLIFFPDPDELPSPRLLRGSPQTLILRNLPRRCWTLRMHEKLSGVRRADRFLRKLAYALIPGKTYER